MTMDFAKVEGAGNDFVLLDCARALNLPAGIVRELCDRHFGVGGDGLLVIERNPPDAPFLRMFNPDGTEDFSGNGMRCAAAWLFSRGTASGGAVTIVSPRGRHRAEVNELGSNRFMVEVDLVKPDFAPSAVPAVTSLPRILEHPVEILGKKWPISVVSVGTAHTAIFTEGPVDESTFFEVSPLLERHAMFPERTSVLWCVVERLDRVIVRIWERGVGETFSCGTGACAVVAIGSALGRTARRVDVVARGGTLTAAWDGHGPVRLTGPARIVYTGTYRPR